MHLMATANDQTGSLSFRILIQGPFEKFVDWQQCAAVMQREVVTVLPCCSGGSNVVVAQPSSL
jgi:hypothetical protein